MRPFALGVLAGCLAANAAAAVGIFDGNGDIGTVVHSGSVKSESSRYVIAASGENLWGTADAFHFVWKKMSGDITLAADISFPTAGGDPHKKAVLMIRQTLDADSAYADIALHGNGLTSLQARDARGEATHEIQANLSAPKRLRLQKKGDYFYMFLPEFAGGSLRVPMTGEFYVGIGVSAHNKEAVEMAEFANVAISAAPASGRPRGYSTLETITVQSTDRRVSFVSTQPIAAPNWTRDGASLVFNAGGKLQRMAVEGGEPRTLEAGTLRWSVHHGFSPDGTLLAGSAGQGDEAPRIYLVPSNGGAPKLLTVNSPSWFQGWSPDGKTILFSGRRNNRTGLYAISVDGGDEAQLTHDEDSPETAEYSPDGQFVYFDSTRTGSRQIWRMLADGAGAEQVTADNSNNSTPHLSPDGKRLVFLSWAKDAALPEPRDLMLRSMSLENNNKITVLAKLTGGKGTVDSPSWSPDSRRLAFVSYQSVP